MSYKSSYNTISILNFGDIIKTLTFQINPKLIVEFGILYGFSLKCFADTCQKSCQVKAYDIFEEFEGNGANYNDIITKFDNYNNIEIGKLDFYEGYKQFEDNSIDILHIDIANNGDVYKFTIDNYMSKISDNGIIILEGGSVERDNISWMIKYNKTKINPYIQELKNKGYGILLISKMPSITIIKKH
jgi:predicted O-methyltransferase YrrM